jgi:hypothetical protein
MQLPYDWFIYVIPGSLFLSVFLLCDRYRDKSLKFIKENGIIAIPIIIILSFLIGFAENTALSKIRSYEPFKTVIVAIGSTSSETPLNHRKQMLINQYSNPSQLEEYRSNYSGMVFTRLIIPPLIILSLVGSIKIFKLKWLNKLRWKNLLKILASISIMIWILMAFFYQWKDERQNFNETEKILIDTVRAIVGDSVWNSTCNKEIK